MKRNHYARGRHTSKFIAKLYEILQDERNHAIIRWTAQQTSFIINNIDKFTTSILPQYFKHSNYSSFIRQLNMYSFSKIRNEQQGENVYKNEIFFKGNDENLKLIYRRQIINYTQKYINYEVKNQKSKININNQKCNHIQKYYQYKKNIIQQDQLFLFELENNVNQQKELNKLQCQINKMQNQQEQFKKLCMFLYKQNQGIMNQNEQTKRNIKMKSKHYQKLLQELLENIVRYIQSKVNSNETYYQRYREEQEQQSSEENYQRNEQMINILQQSFQQHYEHLNQRNNCTDRTVLFKAVINFIEKNNFKIVMKALRGYLLMDQIKCKNKNYTIINHEKDYISSLMQLQEKDEEIKKYFDSFQDIKHS